MDKPKIVIICGTGSFLSSGYIERLIAAGKVVFDIKVMDANNTFFGGEPDVMIWDDLQSMDFTSLEERVKEPLLRTFGVENVPADQRKGPKGPRGKWGKLK